MTTTGDSKLFTGGDREYTAEEISQVGMIYGDTAKAKMARAVYDAEKGEDGKDISELFGRLINKDENAIEENKNSAIEVESKEDNKNSAITDKTTVEVDPDNEFSTFDGRGTVDFYDDKTTPTKKTDETTVEEVKSNVNPAEILIDNEKTETNILKPDAAKGYENLSLSDKRLMAGYFKEFGETGPVLEKYADLQHNDTANKMRSMQGMMNKLGLDVGGDAAEWLQFGNAYGDKSKNAYNLLRTEWSDKDEKEWGYTVE